jgi:hypothetical protein
MSFLLKTVYLIAIDVSSYHLFTSLKWLAIYFTTLSGFSPGVCNRWFADHSCEFRQRILINQITRNVKYSTLYIYKCNNCKCITILNKTQEVLRRTSGLIPVQSSKLLLVLASTAILGIGPLRDS